MYLASALAKLSHDGKMYGYEMEGTWHDCGNKFGFWKANFEIGLKSPEIADEAKQYLENHFKENFNS